MHKASYNALPLGVLEPFYCIVQIKPRPLCQVVLVSHYGLWIRIRDPLPVFEQHIIRTWFCFLARIIRKFRSAQATRRLEGKAGGVREGVGARRRSEPR